MNVTFVAKEKDHLSSVYMSIEITLTSYTSMIARLHQHYLSAVTERVCLATEVTILISQEKEYYFGNCWKTHV